MRTAGLKSAALAMAATAVFGLVQSAPAQAAPAAVGALLGTKTTLSEPAIARYGTQVTVKGKVASLTSGLGLGSTDVQLTFDPAKGATKTLTVHTDGNGRFVATYTPRYRTVIRAATPASLLYAASSAKTVLRVEAPVKCTIGDTRAAAGAWEVPGSCAVKGLPAGTKFIVQTRGDGTWHTVLNGRTQTSRLSFVLPLHQHTTAFRVYVFPAKKWVATASNTFKVSV